MKNKIFQSIFYAIFMILAGKTYCMNRLFSLQNLLPFAKEMNQISDSTTEIIFKENTPSEPVLNFLNDLARIRTVNSKEPRYNTEIKFKNQKKTVTSLRLERATPKITYAPSKSKL